MKRIIYTRPDGGVSVVNPAPQAKQLSETEDAFVLRVAAKDVPVTLINPPVGVSEMMARADATRMGFAYRDTPFQIVEATAIPVDRTFRNALKSDLTFDMPKCRDIWRDKLRELRRPKMQILDAAYMQADERGDTVEKTRLAAEKQKLRDVTADPAIEAAQTPEELKTVMPAILK